MAQRHPRSRPWRPLSLALALTACLASPTPRLCAQESGAPAPQLSSATDANHGVAVGLFANPPGASLFVDGERAGTGKYIGHLRPGVHIVQFELPGHGTVQERLTLEEGDGPTYLVVHLRPNDVSVVRAGRTGGALDTFDHAPLAWGLTAGGALLLVGGAILLAYHGDADCASSEPDCGTAHDTLVPGATFTTLGAAALTAGVLFVLWDELAGRPPASDSASQSAPRLGFAPADGGGLLWLEASF